MAYNPVEWNTGDVITAAKLNNMDNGIDANDEAISIVNDKITAIGSVDSSTSGALTLTVDGSWHQMFSKTLSAGTYIVVCASTISLGNTLQSGMRINIDGASSQANLTEYTGASEPYVTMRSVFPIVVSNTATINVTLYSRQNNPTTASAVCVISACRVK